MNPHYIGVTGFTSRQQIEEVVACLPREMKIGNRKQCLMAGILVSSKTLAGKQNSYPNKYPAVENISSILSDDERVMNFLHFSCDDKKFLSPQIDQLMDIVNSTTRTQLQVHGIQLNVKWPHVADLCYIKRRHQVLITLQVGARALSECGCDVLAVREKIEEYLMSAEQLNTKRPFDYILLDLSAGQGKELNVSMMKRYIDELLKIQQISNGEILLGVAGGLSHDNLDILEPLTERYPALVIDAEGKLRGDSSTTDEQFVFNATNYVKNAIVALDPTKPKCQVCGQRKSIGVCSSRLGAFSVAYCRVCILNDAEPEWAFSATYSTVGDNVAEWVKEIKTYVVGQYLTWTEWLECYGENARNAKQEFDELCEQHDRYMEENKDE